MTPYERHGVPNEQQFERLLTSLSELTTKIIKQTLWENLSLTTSRFPFQMASNTENNPILGRRYDIIPIVRDMWDARWTNMELVKVW